MKLLFCNIGWMEKYQGLGLGDSIRGGGAYVKEKGLGHEIMNFKAVNGEHFGYVQAPSGQIDLTRIGAGPDDESLSGVTVVWTASRPTGGTVVVGWYRNATVYRHYQEFKTVSKEHRKYGLDGFWVEAGESDATLLPVDERTCEIPRRVNGSMGQSNIWYADKPESQSIVEQVLRALKFGVFKSPAKPRSGGRRRTDPEHNAKIEKAAVHKCWKHYEALGYEVNSVEKDNVGWDLEATSGRITLKIEVKGLSSDSATVELTPNEYKAFSSCSADYRLAVVVSALSKPTLSIIRFSEENDGWIVDEQDGRKVEIAEKMSATICCS